METNKVVVRFKDGSIMKGKTNDFFPNKTSFHLETLNGETKTIDVEQLKAFFWVKDFEGNKNYDEDYEDEIAGTGRKIIVKFSDGESIIGYTLGYSPDRQGFFMTPADVKSNNQRIFVVKSASEKIEFI
ncbi:MAG: hypothetical protein OET18_16630 [Desulfobacterales bacterium]|jgi:hypothetical protein|nr:hypothetical protein [Desulfobacterales bacterium]